MTHFECGWIYSDSLIANCLLILRVKNKNWLIFGEVMRRTKMVPFLARPVHHSTRMGFASVRALIRAYARQ